MITNGFISFKFYSTMDSPELDENGFSVESSSDWTLSLPCYWRNTAEQDRKNQMQNNKDVAYSISFVKDERLKHARNISEVKVVDFNGDTIIEASPFSVIDVFLLNSYKILIAKQ